jgi:DNA replication protein DnaC
MMDDDSVMAFTDLLETAGVPASARLWTTSRSVELWDRRIPLQRDQGNAAAADRMDADNLAFAKDKRSRRKWLMLCGKVGRGKTAWATGHFSDIVAERVNRNKRWGSERPPVWLTEAALFRRAEARSHDGYHGRSIFLNGLITCPVLLLDDLGGNRRTLTNWQGGAMRDLLSERHANLRTTIITTNIETWDEVEKRYGDHIVSRLIESCGVMVRMDGQDRRLNVREV